MEYLQKPVSPCTKSCQFRDAYCRIDCEDYKEYEEKYRAYYEEKTRRRKDGSVYHEYVRSVNEKYRKRKGR